MHQKIFGTVVHGLGKGKDFGFPTANIKLENSELHIDKGVYVVMITVGNQSYKGMLYVGTRPTLDLKDVTIEIHILDFNEDIYNMCIFFQILHKIRDEVHFSDTDKLIYQLHHDRKMVYGFLKK